MPTANKETKSTVQSNAGDIQDPQTLVRQFVDKKIRNLEKRKGKLQDLQQLEVKGQTLEPEQQKAIKKLDQVVEMIDLMKDLSKSITEALAENTKQQKKQQKKEMLDKQIERQQQEIERLKTIIKYQDILGRFEANVRQDFTAGTNGAIKLTEDQLTNLDSLYTMINEVSADKIETTAEKLIALADGKSREAWSGVTFHQLKDLMNSIVDTNYFANEKTTATMTLTPADTNTSTVKPDEPTKNYPKDKTSSQNGTKTTSVSNQFHSVQNDFSNLTQLQSPFASGISFMTGNSLDKDPAVVAVASVANNFSAHVNSYQTYGEPYIANSHPDANTAPLNQQKTTNFENTSAISTIPTQTFTNQHFAAIMTSNTGFSAVPVTIAPVITGLVGPDLSGQMTTAEQLIATQAFGNHQNYMNSTNDKHSSTNTSHERPNTFNDEHRNRGQRNRSDNKKNLNGNGNRPRNANKGQSYGQNQMFNNYSKYDNQMNGSNFNNTFTEKTPNNNFRGNRGPPQGQRPPRTDKPRPERNNQNYSANLATAAK